VLPTRPGVELSYASDDLKQFSQALRSRTLTLEDLMINTAHPQGGNPMAAAGTPGAKTRVVDENARVVGLDNVFVTDASVFPTSLTVNPQWTIMALSSLAADRIE
jgi:choline dehydrogenase-like flavoprotein